MTRRRRDSKPERFVSKRQLSKWQRQQRTRKIITIVGLAVIVAVVAILGVGYYSAEVRPYTRAVIKVNDTTLNMRYYINVLRLYRGNGQSGIPDEYLPDYVASQMIQQELVRQGAASLGMQVERSDAEAKLTKANVPVMRETVDSQVTSDLVDKLREEYFTPKVAVNQPQVHVQAMLLESADAAQQMKARLAAGETFDNLAEELSKEGITKSKKGDLGWVAGHEAELLLGSEKVGSLMLGAAAGSISDPVYDDTVTKGFGFWVVRVLEKTDASSDGATPKGVHAEGILVGSEQEARDVMENLNAGADFEALAKEVSQQYGVKDGTTSADMGLINYSDTLSVFEKTLFDLPVGTVSGPISDSSSQTKGGYWLFNVLEMDDNRALTADQVNVLVGDLLNKWAADLASDPNNKVQNLLDPQMKYFALQQALGAAPLILQ